MSLIIAAPFLLLLVVFALSNGDTVQLGIWPTDLTVQAPLSIAMLAAMGVAFLIGGLLAWGPSLAQRRRARRAERRVRMLEAQVEELRARLAAPVSLAAPDA